MQQPISKTELLQLADKQITAKPVDIRSAEEYKNNHIPEAVNIPSETLENHLQSFSKNDFIVCICNHGKQRSRQAATFLYNACFTNTHYLTSGVGEWYAVENNAHN
jgi:rhodanese-related sulfurtransferase